jgi:maltose-binding protein MalE
MKKFIIAAIFAVLIIGFVAACTNETAEETTELFSPDPDEYKRPGGGG